MRTIILLTLIAVGALACTKSAPVTPGLFGKWELRHSYGGLAGFDSVYKAGNGNILQFNSDSTYKRFEANKPAATGVFHIKHYNNPTENSISEYTISFDNNNYEEPFHMKGTTITIGTTITDQVASDFQKISD